MTFEYMQPSQQAVDEDRHYALRYSSTFYDVSDCVYLSLRDQQNALSFDFPVATKDETRTFQTKSGAVSQLVDVYAFILKQDVTRLYTRMKTACDKLSIVFFSEDDFAIYLQQAIFTLLTEGGGKLKFVPDYEVKFVETRPE